MLFKLNRFFNQYGGCLKSILAICWP